jgi:hypothetical protein
MVNLTMQSLFQFLKLLFNLTHSDTPYNSLSMEQTFSIVRVGRGAHPILGRFPSCLGGVLLALSWCAIASNAGPELRLKAEARNERTLEAVSSRPMFK